MNALLPYRLFKPGVVSLGHGHGRIKYTGIGHVSRSSQEYMHPCILCVKNQTAISRYAEKRFKSAPVEALLFTNFSEEVLSCPMKVDEGNAINLMNKLS